METLAPHFQQWKDQQKNNTAKCYLGQVHLKKTPTEHQPTATEHTWNICSKTDHMIGHKAGFNFFFKKIQIISNTFSDHSAMKAGMHNRNVRNYTNTWKLNNLQVSNQWRTKVRGSSQ